MNENSDRNGPPPPTPEPDQVQAPVKQQWVTPDLTILDASKTATGGAGAVEELASNKPGS